MVTPIAPAMRRGAHETLKDGSDSRDSDNMYSEQSATPSAASQYFIHLPHLHADHINLMVVSE